MKRVIVLILLVVCVDALAFDQTGKSTSDVSLAVLKAFPGASGFGAYSLGGRGGKVVKVTNLNDSGPGSLRWAVSNNATDYNGVSTGSEPRIIVFEVSGPIVLTSTLSIVTPYITIAGQTAPTPGIMLRNYGVRIIAHDIIIQHLAIRVGDSGSGPYDTLDSLQILNPSYNIIIDHCSMSWAIDENLDTYTDVTDGNNVHDVTFSNNIISEGLRTSKHTDVNHSKGFHCNRRNTNISLIGNLFAHNESRNPMLYGGTEIAIINNIFYNGGAYSYTSIGNPYIKSGDAPPKASIVGNVYLAGPSTLASSPQPAAIKIERTCDIGTQIYQVSNYFPDHNIVTGETEWLVSSPPVSIEDVTIITTQYEIFNSVTTNAGSRPGARDTVDNRIVADVMNGTGTWVDSQHSYVTYLLRNFKCILDHTTTNSQILPTNTFYWQDLGTGTGYIDWEDNHTYLSGYPVYAENTQTFSVPSNYNEITVSGYTVIEELLFQSAASVERLN